MSIDILRRVLPLSAALLLTACGLQPTLPVGDACVAGGFTVTDDFTGARRGACTVLAPNHVQLDIRPEDEGKINNSPWFAFRIAPSAPGAATVTLSYEGGSHRYWPKISADGQNWERLPEDSVTVSDDSLRADLVIPLTGEAVFVSAQELITPVDYDAWNRKVAATTGIPMYELGKSLEGRAIHAFDSNAESKEVLLMIGRQHPPEVSGAVAFFAFTETVFGDSGLAEQFRERFRVIAIPLMNPDGVVAGHWRHNRGSLDINRDWGPFTQPETQLVAGLFDEFDADGSSLRMFVDFHSTDKNTFYAQQEPTEPPDFTRTWLGNAERRVSDYPFTNEESPTENPAVAKNYIYARYGIPAVTFEAGDETDREALRVAAVIFAEELMRLMLAQDY
jgi:predicted deacylase